MAGGPIFPHSTVPITAGVVFPNVAVVAAKMDHIEGMGVEASVSAPGTWRLRFQMPPVIPSGTAKLRLLAYANTALAQNAKVTPKWDSVAAETNVTLAASLSTETVQTLTWGTGDDLQLKELKVILNATTAPAASEIVAMDLVFETTLWTLAAVSTWIASIIWE